MTREEFDDFLSGYLAAAVFSDLEEKYIGRFTTDDIHTESEGAAIKDCLAFLKMAQRLIRDDEHVPGSHDDTCWNHAGRDFWYTRQGHGCGFWDGDWPKHGDALTKVAEQFKEKYLEVERKKISIY